MLKIQYLDLQCLNKCQLVLYIENFIVFLCCYILEFEWKILTNLFVWYTVDKLLIERSILEILTMSLLLDLIVAYISYAMRRYNAEDIS